MIIIGYQHSHHSRIKNSRKPRQALRTFHPVEVVEFMNIMVMIQMLILMKMVKIALGDDTNGDNENCDLALGDW